MLSVPNFKFPRKVSIQVAKAEKLVLSKKDNKKKNNSKFRVVVLGGKKKEASVLIDDSNGNPEWNFSCIVKLHRSSNDPISLLVEDSEGHHKGQVIIPMVKIGPKPYTYSPDQNPATSSNVICSELEPTHKCSSASGYLIYWIWVEEYCSQGDEESKKSIKNSMSSIFGSMNVIRSSKSKSSVKSGSISNISSAMSLNKPESHKKTLSFLNVKSKKDKSKKSSSDCKLTPDSSDVDSHMELGNPFEIDIKQSTRGPHSNKGSFGSSDFHKSSNPFNVATDPSEPSKSYNSFQDRLDTLSHGSHGSISENGLYQPSINSMTPVKLPPTNVNINISDKQSSKYNSQNVLQSPSSNPEINWSMKSGSPSDDIYKPGHKVVNESDYSIFSDHNINHLPSATMKKMNDEAECLRKENSELRMKNSECSRTISQLQIELEYFKDSLYKLRTRLLVEGATKFLEKI